MPEYLNPPQGPCGIFPHAVDHGAPGPNLRGHATGALEVSPKDGGVETVFRIVRDPGRLVLIFELVAFNRPSR